MYYYTTNSKKWQNSLYMILSFCASYNSFGDYHLFCSERLPVLSIVYNSISAHFCCWAAGTWCDFVSFSEKQPNQHLRLQNVQMLYITVVFSSSVHSVKNILKENLCCVSRHEQVKHRRDNYELPFKDESHDKNRKHQAWTRDTIN